jgi:hypothetical protein
LSKIVIGEGEVLRNNLYPSPNNQYTIVEFSGGNIVDGDVYAEESIIIKGDVLVNGSIYSRKIIVENGRLIVLGDIGSRTIDGVIHVRGNVFSRGKVSIHDSLIGKNIICREASISRSFINGFIIGFSENDTAHIDIRNTILYSVVSHGGLYIDNIYLATPVIYVRGEISGSGNLRIIDTSTYSNNMTRVNEYFESLGRDKSLIGFNIDTLFENINIVTEMPVNNIAMPKGNKKFIVLLGDEVAYDRSKVLNEYVARLKSFLGI